MLDRTLEFGVDLLRQRSFLKSYLAHRCPSSARVEQALCGALRRAWLARSQISPDLDLRHLLVEIADTEMEDENLGNFVGQTAPSRSLSSSSVDQGGIEMHHGARHQAHRE